MSKKNFTLIELIITIILVAIISIPLSHALSEYIKSYSFNEDLDYAVTLTRWEIEEIFAANYGNLSSRTVSNYGGYGYDLERNVSYYYGNDTSDHSLKQVDIEVYSRKNNDLIFDFILLRGNVDL